MNKTQVQILICSVKLEMKASQKMYDDQGEDEFLDNVKNYQEILTILKEGKEKMTSVQVQMLVDLVELKIEVHEEQEIIKNYQEILTILERM